MKVDPVRTIVAPAAEPAPPKTAAQAESEAGERALFGAKGVGFHTLLEIINPLQHIPVIGSLYRETTGDTISPVGRIAGGGLFGGVFGLVGSILSSIFEGLTGKDPGAMVVAALRGDKDGGAQTPAATRVAMNSYERASELNSEQYDFRGTRASV
jgi:hypothetical protein